MSLMPCCIDGLPSQPEEITREIADVINIKIKFCLQFAVNEVVLGLQVMALDLTVFLRPSKKGVNNLGD